ncbi:hypothetical protein DFH07DRAFT_776917 [Mycena maculata]|uniref:Uncharacterized protein n=1 Tax=Mycena maculata TaxID=230809 RepID=A0AAD7N4C5_9AGAR|nr:hypothetical protein DFH07DRAFT_776917 [Mycena maculata]
MPAGRPKLKPEVKFQHSRKCYEDQETQRGLMLMNATLCSKRAAIAASDFHTRRRYREKAVLDSEMYRARKRDAELAQSRAATAVKQTKRDVERIALRNRHLVVSQNVPSPTMHAPAAGKKHCPQPPRLPSPTVPLPCPPTSPTFHHSIAFLTHLMKGQRNSRQFGRHASRMRADVPTAMQRSASGARVCVRRLRSGLSTRGTIFSQPASTAKGQTALDAQIFAETESVGHKGPLVHPGPFYAIYCQEWAGCVTSSASRDCLLCQYPCASTFEAPTWAELLRRWFLECEEYHWHPEQNKWSPLVPLSQESSPPSSPLTLTASAPSRTPSPPALAENTILLKRGPLATPHTAQRNAEYSAYLEAEEARLEAEAAAKKKEELAFLASTRENVSPERMCQQFLRVLGPASALEWPPLLSKNSLVSPKESTNVQAHNGEPPLFNPHGQTQACQQCLATAAALPTKHHGEGIEQFWDNVPVMYAVSGQNCVFKDRERTMAAFKEMPGAELVFTRDEDELFSFLEDFEKKFEI